MSTDNLVDTIVRGAAVDLLGSYSIAAAPIIHTHPHAALELPDVAASIEFDAPGFSGTLYLCLPQGLIPRSANAERKATAEDWVRELANQLLGRVKRRLLQSSLNLKTGLPKTGNSRLIERRFERREPARRYDFRTLRGPVVLLLEGTISDTVVSYRGSATDASEGDVILFGSEGPFD